MLNKIKIRSLIFNRIIKYAGPNYDLGDGLYENMDKYDSVKQFRQSPYKSPGAIYVDKKRVDINHIDFPLDDQITSIPMEGTPGPYGNSDQIGFEEKYIANPDLDGKSEDALNFGFDLDDDEAPVGRHHRPDAETFNGLDVKKLQKKYQPAEAEIYGLPDGVGPEAKDADQTIETENPEFGITDSGREMYEDKWNI